MNEKKEQKEKIEQTKTRRRMKNKGVITYTQRRQIYNQKLRLFFGGRERNLFPFSSGFE